jgi:hypothetical protein
MGIVTFQRLKISIFFEEISCLYAPGDSLLTRPRRCGVPKMRYNEFGRTYSELRSSKSTFHFFEKYSGYRIISFFPSNILKKLVVKMTLYLNYLNFKSSIRRGGAPSGAAAYIMLEGSTVNNIRNITGCHGFHKNFFSL